MAPGWRQRALIVAAVAGLAYALERWPQTTITAVTAVSVADFIIRGPAAASPLNEAHSASIDARSGSKT